MRERHVKVSERVHERINARLDGMRAEIGAAVSRISKTFAVNIAQGNARSEGCFVEDGIRELLFKLFPNAVDRSMYLSFLVLCDLDVRSMETRYNLTDAGREQLRQNALRMISARMEKRGKAEPKAAVYVDAETAAAWNAMSMSERTLLCRAGCVCALDAEKVRGEEYPRVGPKTRRAIYMTAECVKMLRDFATQNSIMKQSVVIYFVRHAKEIVGMKGSPSKPMFDIGGVSI